ncbi:MAG: hypothetical protein FJY77_02110 [Candidatus Altiarchaeales archaeon]|nr:hypothetical protein [Candidatus Altiarchaeales archaeon]
MIKKEHPKIGSDGVLTTGEGFVVEPGLLPALRDTSSAVAGLRETDFRAVFGVLEKFCQTYHNLEGVVLAIPKLYSSFLEREEADFFGKHPLRVGLYIIHGKKRVLEGGYSILSPTSKAVVLQTIRKAVNDETVELAGVISERKMSKAESKGRWLNKDYAKGPELNDFWYFGPNKELGKKVVRHLYHRVED